MHVRCDSSSFFEESGVPFSINKSKKIVNSNLYHKDEVVGKLI